ARLSNLDSRRTALGCGRNSPGPRWTAPQGRTYAPLDGVSQASRRAIPDKMSGFGSRTGWLVGKRFIEKIAVAIIAADSDL
ncbi:MAG: hypothetical protein ABSG53_24860, partial [Thermoguttaceae bacterium]